MGSHLSEWIIRREENHCREYFFARTSKYFFGGYSLVEVVQDGLFLKLPIFLGLSSYVHEIPSVIAMLALRDNLSARLVQAAIPTKDCRQFIQHSWTEFMYRGRWWVVDFAGMDFYFSPLLRSSYYDVVQPSSKTIYRHRKFWNHPNSVQLEHYLKRHNTSQVPTSSFYEYFGDQKPNDKLSDYLEIVIEKLMNDPNAPTIEPII